MAYLLVLNINDLCVGNIFGFWWGGFEGFRPPAIYEAVIRASEFTLIFAIIKCMAVTFMNTMHCLRGDAFFNP